MKSDELMATWNDISKEIRQLTRAQSIMKFAMMDTEKNYSSLPEEFRCGYRQAIYDIAEAFKRGELK